MTDAAGKRNSIGRFIAGDPLRALAALTVVCYHAAYAIMGRMHARTPKEAYGDVAGVLAANSASVIFIFFCGSGYLLGRPFVRAFVLGRRPPNVGNYARNRVARILPPALVAITATFLIRGTGGSSLPEVLAVYGLVQNYVPSPAQNSVIHLWSVDVEALYYLLLPIAALALMRLFRGRGTQRTRLAVTLGLLGALIVASLAWRDLHPQDVLWQRRLPALLFGLAVGMGLGALEIPGVAWAQRLRRPALLGNAMFAAGWAILLLAPATSAGPGALRRGVIATTGIALVMGGLLVRQWGGAGATRLLDNRVMHAIGRWSYSIFLFHLIVLHELVTHVHASTPPREFAAIIVPTLVGATILGALSFRFIERPCMRFRGVSTQPAAPPVHVPPNVAAELGEIDAGPVRADAAPA